MTGFVYAIENADGFVKIGWSVDPLTRLGSINADTSSPCRLVGTITGTRKQERALHAMLWRSRVHGEWFRKDASIEVVLRYFARRQDADHASRRREADRAAGKPGRKLQTFLDENGLTQRDFADRIGATQGAVARWVNGRRFPSPAVLRAIFAATGGQVTANDFLAEEPAA